MNGGGGGRYGWHDPHSGQGFLFNTKDGGPKHWKILHETPNQTVIGPLWDPQYYFTAGKRWQPQLPETWSYLDLEKIGARVPG